MVRARMRLFEQALRDRGLKSTSQRDDIARAFFGAAEHLSVEELHAAVKKVNPRVGYATVYRTLKLLKECGLADERHFDDGQARYEPTEAEEQHHDHIICERCGKIDFRGRQGEECLEGYVSEMLDDIRAKYKEYGITQQPFVIVKADAGTYGMGIMTVRDPKELAELNRKTRNKMSVIKDGQEVSEVILQEGVPTYERVNDAMG